MNPPAGDFHVSIKLLAAAPLICVIMAACDVNPPAAIAEHPLAGQAIAIPDARTVVPR